MSSPSSRRGLRVVDATTELEKQALQYAKQLLAEGTSVDRAIDEVGRVYGQDADPGVVVARAQAEGQGRKAEGQGESEG